MKEERKSSKESLKDKIDYEYERYLLEVTRTSKDNIFASSREIELKKSIKKYMVEFVCDPDKGVEEQVVEGLLLEDNTLEAVYCAIEESFCERLVPSVKVTEGIFKLNYQRRQGA